MRDKEPIAIVGLGCRLPGGANDPDALWRILEGGVDTITDVPADRWNIAAYHDPHPGIPGKTNACRGGFVDGIDRFDAEFFGISPREAARMDPQQRLLLEVAWEALENAGQPAERVAGTAVGVFVGYSSTDYMLLQQAGGDLTRIDAHSNTGAAMSIAANRISYCFDLSGPSLTVDTACSSSLVAVHQACRSLWNGECRQALAGGVNVLIKPEPYVGFSRLSMLSPDGRCKAFDAAADGFVRSEGAALVLLKPYARAVADGDRIYARILGSAVNQDGRTSGLTVPSQHAQEELLREACRQAGVAPARVQFVEAHGPGTLVGDPIEACALGTVLGEGRPADRPCWLGSVKTNLGHLEPAAGIVGLLKVALALHRGAIPPNLHFSRPNPEIPLERLKLRVPLRVEPWSLDDGPPVAGVNSFGFGGTNAHVVLQAEPRGDAERAAHGAPAPGQGPAVARLVPLSARSTAARRALARAVHEHFADGGRGERASWEDICHTSALRRSHHDQRLALVAHDREELLAALAACAAGEAHPQAFPGRGTAATRPRLVFVCSGQGPQWWGMGRELLATEELFREVIERCDRRLRELGDWSLLRELEAGERDSRMHETSIAQPALFALQVALAALWRSWGIEPEAVVGHSVGEVAAAHLCGALDFDDAVRVIFERGRCMDFAAAKGRMLAAALSEGDALALVAGREDRISLAAVNGPASVTLSGDAGVLEEIARALDERGTWRKFLEVQYAFHSPQMDALRGELLDSLRGIAPRPPRLPMISTVSGERVEGPELVADYWWRNVRRPVRFAGAIDALMGQDYRAFLELAPHPVLSASVVEVAQRRGIRATVVHSLRRETEERATLLRALGALYGVGFDPRWEALVPPGGRLTAFPTYPWQRERHWSETNESLQSRTGPAPHPLLGRRGTTVEPTWTSRPDPRVVRYLADHCVQGHALLSATSYLEMALAAAREARGGGPWIIEDLRLLKACFLQDEDPPTVELTLEADGSGFRVHGRPAGSTTWTEHAAGRVRVAVDEVVHGIVDLEALRSRLTDERSGEECYRRMREAGLEYGPTFRGIDRIWCGPGEALARVCIPEGLDGSFEAYQLHPATLDACLQAITGTLPEGSAAGGVYLPVEIARVRVRGRIMGPVWSHARIGERAARGFVASVVVCDDRGEVLAEVGGLRCQRVEGVEAGAGSADDLVYEYRWIPAPRAPQEGIRSAGCLASSARVREATRAAWRTIAADLRPAERSAQLEPGLDALCTSIVLKALADLGLRLEPGERFSAPGLSLRLELDPKHGRLFARLLQFLEADGILGRRGEEWEVLRRAPAVDPQPAWRELLAAHPSSYAELMLLGRCGGRLAQILRGEVDALELIFPEGSLALAEHLYQDSPSLRPSNLLARRAVEALVEALPAGREVRVLEIGAGTGGLSSYVLPVLPAERTRYTYTDLSNHFFLKAEEKLRGFPFVEFKRLDIERDPLAQELEPHAYDLILASECLHATVDLRQTLAHVKRLLASEGRILLLEAVRRTRWVDLVFGLTEGWWRFADADLRPDHPLLTLEAWRGLLSEQGFDEVFEASGQDAGRVENALILARGPRVGAERAEPAPDAPPRAPGTWVIWADRGGAGSRLAGLLRERGERTVTVTTGPGYRRIDAERFEISPSSAEDARRLLREAAPGDAPACRGIVHLWSLDAPPEITLEALETQSVTGCLSAVHLAQALTVEELASPVPHLWLVTRGAWSVGTAGDEATAPAQAGLWGFGRVAGNELGKVRPTLVDLGPDGGADEMRFLCDELFGDSAEDELALRGAARYVHRYFRAPERRSARDGGEAYRLEPSPSGVLDRLTLRARPRVEPGRGRVEIEVAAAGLNFADVMKALALYPGLTDGPVPLGIECSGRVAAVGQNVSGLAVGDEVLAIAPFAFGSHVETDARLVARKPARVSHDEAATVPIAFLTAHYALNHLGRMRAGERVLIHSATGGVGLAAIQLARLAGVEVFATAGTPDKRGLLRLLGVEHVMDSRRLDFAERILEITGGRGVDLVLNSLAGEAIDKGLEALADHGRFLEIGKRDIYGNRKLGLLPFRKNLSFMAIDLDAAMRERPELLSELFHELVARLDGGEIAPLPHRVFPAFNVTQAFRTMSQARHIGKIVVSMRERPAAVAPAPLPPTAFREDATYLITGGLGGFGLLVAGWMVERGARHLVLMGRSGADAPAAREAVERLRRDGARIEVARADVADERAVNRVLAEIRRDGPPLRGVLHAAMVLRDGLIADLNRERLDAVWAPKVAGAWNLHRGTLEDPLDFFVLFSSLSSVFGVGGQANYASANACLDSLAFHRRAMGRTATTINWGSLGEVGWVAQHDDIARRLGALGVRPLTPAQALGLLGRFVHEQPALVGVMGIDWQAWSAVAGTTSISPRFADLVRESLAGVEPSRAKGGAALRAELVAADPARRRELLESLLRSQVARVLGAPASRLDVERPLTEMGLDSLMGVELRNWIEGELGLSLPTVELMRGPSVVRLAEILAGQLGREPAAAPAPAVPEQSAPADAQRLVARVDELSDGEVDALLEHIAKGERVARP